MKNFLIQWQTEEKNRKIGGGIPLIDKIPNGDLLLMNRVPNGNVLLINKVPVH